MTDFAAVRSSSFHTELIERLVRQANDGTVPENNLFQLETTFSEESVFRHFDYLGLRGNLLTSIHVDELPKGVRWYMNLVPVRQVSAVELGQFSHPSLEPLEAADEGDPGLTVLVTFSAHRSVELEPMRCDDPTCTADHGLVGGSKDEGLVMSFGSPESSGEDDAMSFVSALASAMAQS